MIKMIKKIKSFSKMFLYKYRQFLRVRYLSKIRRKNNNRDVTFISNDCTAGILYKELDLKYFSPFLWNHIDENSFLYMLLNLEAYLDGALTGKEGASAFPVCFLNSVDYSLTPIKIDYFYSKNINECLSNWKRRIKRINKNNMFIVFNIWQFDNFDIELFNRVKEKYGSHFIAFSHIKFSHLKNYIYINTGKKYYPGKIFDYHRFGKSYFDKINIIKVIKKI